MLSSLREQSDTGVGNVIVVWIGDCGVDRKEEVEAVMSFYRRVGRRSNQANAIADR